MTDFAGLERQREEHTGVLVARDDDCTHCKATETVVTIRSNGIEYGFCTKCKTRYLPPDWDSAGKELA